MSHFVFACACCFCLLLFGETWDVITAESPRPKEAFWPQRDLHLKTHTCTGFSIEWQSAAAEQRAGRSIRELLLLSVNLAAKSWWRCVCACLCVSIRSTGGSMKASTLGSYESLPKIQKWAALPDPPQIHRQLTILCLRGRRGVFPECGTDFSGHSPDRRVAFVWRLNDTADSEWTEGQVGCKQEWVLFVCIFPIGLLICRSPVEINRLLFQSRIRLHDILMCYMCLSLRGVDQSNVLCVITATQGVDLAKKEVGVDGPFFLL